jgi:hypothetical protein
MDKIILKHVSDSIYTSDSGLTIMRREFGQTPNGNDMAGRWVLRDSKNNIIDLDQFRNDLAERNNLILEEVIKCEYPRKIQ